MGRQLGEILVEKFGISVSKLGDALDQQTLRKLRLGELLIGMKAVTAEQVREALGLQLDLPVQEIIDANGIPDEVLRLVPINFSRNARLVPLRVTTTVSNPGA